MVEPTHLKNISQNGFIFPIIWGENKKNTWNHHLDDVSLKNHHDLMDHDGPNPSKPCYTHCQLQVARSSLGASLSNGNVYDIPFDVSCLETIV